MNIEYDILDSGLVKLKGIKDHTISEIKTAIEELCESYGYKDMVIINAEANSLILKPKE